MTAPVSAEIDRVARQIVDVALAAHRALGPGLLESIYQMCLAYELAKRGLPVNRQVAVPIQCDGLYLDASLQLDMLIAEEVIAELKAVEVLLPVYMA